MSYHKTAKIEIRKLSSDITTIITNRHRFSDSQIDSNASLFKNELGDLVAKLNKLRRELHEVKFSYRDGQYLLAFYRP